MVAALIVPACLALAACGGDDEEAPDTQVVVPTATATPAPASGDGTYVDGYLLSADERKLILRTQNGIETLRVSAADLPVLDIPHLQSHAGLTDIGFRIEYAKVGKRRFAKTATEIPPPF